MKILVIPDIHGRRFWKSACEQYINQVDYIVFLGDYCDPYYMEYDPYTSDNIFSDQRMIDNLNDIINFKAEHQDKVILLMGNHDMHYYSRSFYDIALGSRYSQKYDQVLTKIFNDNNKYFQYAFAVGNKEKTILFSHAGLTLNTYNDLCKQYNRNELYPEELTEILNEDNDNINDIIFRVGYSRGGMNKTGGIFWADVTDFIRNNKDINVPLKNNLIQITGHNGTKEPICTPYYITCDCKKAYLYDTDTYKLSELTGKEVN